MFALVSLVLAGLTTSAIAETPEALAQASDSVTTREATLTVDGTTYQHVQFEGHDYFIKATRPGSALVEVSCKTPSPSTSQPDLKVASRSRQFVDQLQEGCQAKAGGAPDRFTFEQRSTPSAQSGPEKRKEKIELLGRKNFPDDVDPHILPEQPAGGGNFDWKERRY